MISTSILVLLGPFLKFSDFYINFSAIYVELRNFFDKFFKLSFFEYHIDSPCCHFKIFVCFKKTVFQKFEFKVDIYFIFVK